MFGLGKKKFKLWKFSGTGLIIRIINTKDLNKVSQNIKYTEIFTFQFFFVAQGIIFIPILYYINLNRDDLIK